MSPLPLWEDPYAEGYAAGSDSVLSGCHRAINRALSQGSESEKLRAVARIAREWSRDLQGSGYEGFTSPQ